MSLIGKQHNGSGADSPTSGGFRIRLLFVLAVVFAGSGAGCPRMMTRPRNADAPIVLQPGATLNQVLIEINRAGEKVQQLQTLGAELSVGSPPKLKAMLALQRPHSIRVTAGIFSPTGELDLGSNPTEFWMWIKREGALYHGLHQTAAANHAVPVSPQWLMEAIGIMQLTASDVLHGPVAVADGKLEVLTRFPLRPDLTRRILIDAQHGWILEQHVVAANQQLVASAIASEYRFDPVYSVSLPHQVDINLPTVPMQFRLKVDEYLINQLAGNPEQLWQMPDVDAERHELTGPAGTPNIVSQQPWGGPQPNPPAIPDVHGQPQYGQPQYGQPQYGQPQYGQPQYGQPLGNPLRTGRASPALRAMPSAATPSAATPIPAPAASSEAGPNDEPTSVRKGTRGSGWRLPQVASPAEASAPQRLPQVR